MNIESRITRKSNLEANDSLSGFDGHVAQQSNNVYKIFYDFLLKVKPKRIIEIGTATGGFTMFLKTVSNECNLNIDILTYDIYGRINYDSIIEYGIDLRIENIFEYPGREIPEYLENIIKSDGTTIILCDGGNKINEFNILSKYLKPNDFILAHDYSEDLAYFNKNINGKIWNWCEITYKDIENAVIENNLINYDPESFINAVWVCMQKK
jgi:hypothetical protein